MAKIISFDIWDTILKRKCHPEEIKLHTANYLMLKHEQNLKEKYKDIYEILKLRDQIEADMCKANKENGVDDGKGKYQSRYAFSGQIICGE